MNNNNDTVRINPIFWGSKWSLYNHKIMLLLHLLFQISVWSSGLPAVGGKDRHTMEKLKEGEMKTCSCMKAELSE